MDQLIELPTAADAADLEKQRIEARIKRAFRELLYAPILAELSLSRTTLQNSYEVLLHAIASGKIHYSGGRFYGRLSATTTKELRTLGAVWDRRKKNYRLSAASLPVAVRAAIATSQARFEEKLKRIDRQLAQTLPEEIADSVKTADLFDTALWKTDREFERTLSKLTVAPELTPARRKKIADEWQENMDKWIKGWTEQEIIKLRKSIQRSVFAGNRYESVVRSIKQSYGATENKARFLARQETNLLLSKFKEARYTDSGVPEYKWKTVVGSPKHPVRHSHKILDGKIFRWDTPPITTGKNEPQRRNNPGEDFGCRCSAVPVVRFKSL